jgi:hypothetical protein
VVCGDWEPYAGIPLVPTLGYAHQGEIITSTGPVKFIHYTERHAQAQTKLFIKFGLKLDEANLPEWQAFIEALKRMARSPGGRGLLQRLARNALIASSYGGGTPCLKLWLY